MKKKYPFVNNLVTCSLDFTHLFDEIPLGVLILDMDRRVVFFNRAFEVLSGFSLSDTRGIHCRNILRSSVCMNDCPALKINHDRGAVSCESDMINLTRDYFPIKITTAPVIDMDGNIVGYIETIEDIRVYRQFDKKSVAYSFANIIGRSLQMEKIFQILPIFAQSDTTILITGETGTGKDLVAEAIHQTSERVTGSFIKINCGALPETLLESEIFGHQKGAFTGAVENKPGRFKLAHNGTIFLTEIGDLPLSLQVKLLTFLDDKIIYPLGSTKGFKVNVRMITATHRNLEKMVKEGKFRKDLLFRLNVAKIHLPPLKERDGDVRLLLDYFFNSYTKQLGKNISGFSQEVLDILMKYRYEGNIRELKNIVEYAVNVADKSIIEIKHLPAYIMEKVEHVDSRLEYPLENNKLFKSSSGFDAGEAILEKTTWASMEKKMILAALVQAKGKKIKAAHILGWGRSKLWRKIKQHQLE